MTKKLSQEEKDRRAADRSHKGTGSNGKKHTSGKKGGKDESQETAPATAPVEGAAAEPTPQAEQAAAAPPANGHPVAAAEVAPATPPKKTLTAEQTLDLGLTRIVKEELRGREELTRIDAEQEELRTAIAALGLEVPEDEDEPATQKKARTGMKTLPRKNNAGQKAASRQEGRASGGLWGIVQKFLFKKGYIAPNKFCPASELFKLAEENGYSTAANLLSQKAKASELVKEGRGNYALPKGTKSVPA